jgi:hypothetical protein
MFDEARGLVSTGSKGEVMAKVYGMHEIELNPGVSGEDLERFFRERMLQVPSMSGWKLMLLKGDRGEREGKYLLLIEIESVEARNRVSPEAGGLAEEGRQWWETNRTLYDEWARLGTVVGSGVYTDYVVVAGDNG